MRAMIENVVEGYVRAVHTPWGFMAFKTAIFLPAAVAMVAMVAFGMWSYEVLQSTAPLLCLIGLAQVIVCAPIVGLATARTIMDLLSLGECRSVMKVWEAKTIEECIHEYKSHP